MQPVTGTLDQRDGDRFVPVAGDDCLAPAPEAQGLPPRCNGREVKAVRSKVQCLDVRMRPDISDPPKSIVDDGRAGRHGNGAPRRGDRRAGRDLVRMKRHAGSLAADHERLLVPAPASEERSGAPGSRLAAPASSAQASRHGRHKTLRARPYARERQLIARDIAVQDAAQRIRHSATTRRDTPHHAAVPHRRRRRDDRIAAGLHPQGPAGARRGAPQIGDPGRVVDQLNGRTSDVVAGPRPPDVRITMSSGLTGGTKRPPSSPAGPDQGRVLGHRSHLSAGFT